MLGTRFFVLTEVEVMESQTDEFLPEQPAEQYQPQRTGDLQIYSHLSKLAATPGCGTTLKAKNTFYLEPSPVD